MKHLDLFSGIGGFALAARWMGWETVGFCDNDTFCRQVLAKHWPGVAIHNDVRELKGHGLGTVDLITGGYPCQPFSTAGKRRGADDDRHLWPEMFRIILEARPRWVLGENVAGHLSMGLDRVLSDLAGAGYEAQPFVIPACAVGAPHRRDRVWIVAHSMHGGCGAGSHHRQKRQVCADQERNATPSLPNGKQPQPNAGEICQTDANTNCPRQPHHQGQRAAAGPYGRHTIKPDGWWDAEPDVGRVAHGIPRRVDRLRALGNAIVPQVAFQIFQAIEEAERVSL